MEEFGLELPKIELHAHLNGSISETTLKSLRFKKQDSISEYENINSTNLEEVFDLFKVAHNVTSTKFNLYRATRHVIREFSRDNVIYLELRTTPRAEKNMTEDEYIATVLKAIIVCRDRVNILTKLLLSLDRRRTYEEQSKCLDTIIKYKKIYPNIIRGVDLSGDPAKGSFYKDLFEKARANGLYTAIHCAEIKNDDEVMEILKFKPDRLGHGTCLHPSYGGSVDIWELYKSLNIPVECCLSSNVICSVSKSYKEHHVKEWINNNLPFCLGTDDKGIFRTSLSEEFLHAHHAFGLDKLYLWMISMNSVRYSFALPEEKSMMYEILEKWKIRNI